MEGLDTELELGSAFFQPIGIQTSIEVMAIGSDSTCEQLQRSS
jgi:hypothetical protein